jgi:hypothetical protein
VKALLGWSVAHERESLQDAQDCLKKGENTNASAADRWARRTNFVRSRVRFLGGSPTVGWRAFVGQASRTSTCSRSNPTSVTFASSSCIYPAGTFRSILQVREIEMLRDLLRGITNLQQQPMRKRILDKESVQSRRTKGD